MNLIIDPLKDNSILIFKAIKMKRTNITLLVMAVLNLPLLAQNEIPKDVIEEWTMLTKDGGKWQSTNYVDQYDAWEMMFTWGLGKKSVNASLYAVKDGKNLGKLWDYKMFYHPESKEVILEQWGSDGGYGVGTLVLKGNGESENISAFHFPGGSMKIKHVQRMEGDTKYSDVFIQDQNGQWQLDREYTWSRIN